MKTFSSLTSPSIPFVLAVFGQKWPKKLDENKMKYKKPDNFPVHLPIGSSQNLPIPENKPILPGWVCFLCIFAKISTVQNGKKTTS